MVKKLDILFIEIGEYPGGIFGGDGAFGKILPRNLSPDRILYHCLYFMEVFKICIQVLRLPKWTMPWDQYGGLQCFDIRNCLTEFIGVAVYKIRVGLDKQKVCEKYDFLVRKVQDGVTLSVTTEGNETRPAFGAGELKHIPGQDVGQARGEQGECGEEGLVIHKKILRVGLFPFIGGALQQGLHFAQALIGFLEILLVLHRVAFSEHLVRFESGENIHFCRYAQIPPGVVVVVVAVQDQAVGTTCKGLGRFE